jgi:hypothetical protein
VTIIKTYIFDDYRKFLIFNGLNGVNRAPAFCSITPKSDEKFNLSEINLIAFIVNSISGKDLQHYKFKLMNDLKKFGLTPITLTGKELEYDIRVSSVEFDQLRAMIQLNGVCLCND